MNETSNESGNPNPSGRTDRPLFESLRNAIDKGAEEARAAAQRAVPQIKAVLSDVAYCVGYGASFAATYSYTLATELAPEPLKAGGRDGAYAGKKAAEDFVKHQAKPAEGQPSDPITGPPSGPAAGFAQP